VTPMLARSAVDLDSSTRYFVGFDAEILIPNAVRPGSNLGCSHDLELCLFDHQVQRSLQQHTPTRPFRVVDVVDLESDPDDHIASAIHRRVRIGPKDDLVINHREIHRESGRAAAPVDEQEATDAATSQKPPTLVHLDA
jgi:hypothetical protein